MIGARLDNITGGGLQLPTENLVELVATNYFKNAPVKKEPWWLNYLGRFGQVRYSNEEEDRVENVLTRALSPFLPVVAHKVAETITRKVFELLRTVMPDGPEPPKAKGWWNSIQADGPWREAEVYQISRSPGNSFS